MPLHNKLKLLAENQENNNSKAVEDQYKRARPYLRFIRDYIGEGKFGVNVLADLKSGNPNVERLLFYREGYEHAMRTFLELIDPT